MKAAFAASDSEAEGLHDSGDEESTDFLFACSLPLGFASNNYAEYMGLILAMLTS